MSIHTIYKQQDDGAELMYAWFTAMHTRIDMILCNKPEDELKELVGKMSDELKRIEKMGDFFSTKSELYYLNSHKENNPAKVSEELFGIIADCIHYHQKTYGYFDVTIHSDERYEDIASKVILSETEHTITFTHKGICLNLSGYLKGYALERLRTILLEHKIEHTLINIGNSSVMALGNHPYGSGWKIGFGVPKGMHQGESIVLHDECLTTSGNEDKKKSHIINPKTGEYMEGVKRLSVITKNGIDGEVLSTALFAASPEDRKLIEANFELKIIYE